jgi:hypothetical protein
LKKRHLKDDIISSVCTDIHSRFPKITKKKLSRDDIAQKCNLQVPQEFKNNYIGILYKHQEAISIDKYNLGLEKNCNAKG